MKKPIMHFLAALLIFSMMLVSSGAESLTAEENTARFYKSTGYRIPITGTTAADLTPLSDFITAMRKNIYSVDPRSIDILNTGIGDNVRMEYMTFFIVSFMARPTFWTFSLKLPYSYKNMEKVFKIAISTLTGATAEETDTLYESLLHNVKDEWSTLQLDSHDCFITYYEPRSTNGTLAQYADLYIDSPLAAALAYYYPEE